MFTLRHAHIDEGNFKDAVGEFKKRAELQLQTSLQVNAAVHQAELSCRELIALAGSDVLHCSLVDKALTISANDRTLTFIPAMGLASDARLPHPRGSYCSQILVFGHLSGQQESKLLAALRVYPDGICSDGERSWKIAEEPAAFTAYLSGLVADNLLACDLYWPPLADLPEYIQSIAVSDDKVQAQELQQPCIGFQCALPPTTKTSA